MINPLNIQDHILAHKQLNLNRMMDFRARLRFKISGRGFQFNPSAQPVFLFS